MDEDRRMGHDAPGTGELSLIGRAAEVLDDDVATVRHRRWTSLRRDPAFWVGLGLTILFVAAALLAPWLAPWDPDLQDRTVAAYPSGPSPEHLLGTDRTGRDYVSRLLHGARVALVVGVLAAVVATVIGFVVAIVAAYARSPRASVPLPGGRSMGAAVPVESILMRTTDVFLSLPTLLLAMALAAVLHPSLALAGFVITAVLWTGPARIIYGGARAVRDADFVIAARALGASPVRLVTRHVAPQVIPLAIAYGAVTIGVAILFEAALSYLGAGVPPPTASWGNMVADHALYYATDPRLVVLPGLAILLAVLAFTLLGDALRDAFDPRARR
jgi:peptide/nickel transport system permease protein